MGNDIDMAIFDFSFRFIISNGFVIIPKSPFEIDS